MCHQKNIYIYLEFNSREVDRITMLRIWCFEPFQSAVWYILTVPYCIWHVMTHVANPGSLQSASRTNLHRDVRWVTGGKHVNSSQLYEEQGNNTFSQMKIISPANRQKATLKPLDSSVSATAFRWSVVDEGQRELHANNSIQLASCQLVSSVC